MSYIFKPRRGNKTTMSSSTTVLSSGEMFLEYPSSGVGKGDSNIKIGDGSTAYSSLPYAIGSQAPVTFTATSLSNTTANNTTLLGKIVSGASSATMFAAIKNLLTNLNTSVTELNNDLGLLETATSNSQFKLLKVNYSYTTSNSKTVATTSSTSSTTSISFSISAKYLSVDFGDYIVLDKISESTTATLSSYSGFTYSSTTILSASYGAYQYEESTININHNCVIIASAITSTTATVTISVSGCACLLCVIPSSTETVTAS